LLADVDEQQEQQQEQDEEAVADTVLSEQVTMVH